MKRTVKYLILAGFMLLALLAAAGCGGAKPAATTEEPKKPAAAEPVKAVSLVEQVKASGHYGFFKEMAEGKGAEAYPPARADVCIKCHSAVKMLDDKNAKFADFKAGGKHAGQLEGITCRVCHEMGGDKMFTLRYEGVEACGRCHTAEGIKEGKEVHHPQIEMFKGIQGIGVTDKPSRKLAQNFACYDCHFTNQLKHDFKAPTAAEIVANAKCAQCHNDAAKMEANMKAQKDKVKSQLDQLKPRLDNAKKAIDAAKAAKKNVAAAEKAYGIALTDITFVEADKSFGLHNAPYVDELLKTGTAKLDDAENLLK